MKLHYNKQTPWFNFFVCFPLGPNTFTSSIPLSALSGLGFRPATLYLKALSLTTGPKLVSATWYPDDNCGSRVNHVRLPLSVPTAVAHVHGGLQWRQHAGPWEGQLLNKEPEQSAAEDQRREEGDAGVTPEQSSCNTKHLTSECGLQTHTPPPDPPTHTHWPRGAAADCTWFGTSWRSWIKKKKRN